MGDKGGQASRGVEGDRRRDGTRLRLRLVEQARVFKRSWVDMARALVEVRSAGWYRRWGFDDLHRYAAEELHIKRQTVDKLTGSFHALERHAPHVLEWDGVARQVPEVDAVDVFKRAVEQGQPNPQVMAELQQALEEGASPPVLRRRVQSLLQPKDEHQQKRDSLDRLRTSARRLERLLQQVDGLAQARVEEVKRSLAALDSDLDQLAGEWVGDAS